MKQLIRGIPEELRNKKPPIENNRVRLFIFLFISFALLFCFRPTYKNTVEDNAPVVNWLNCFTSKNYDICDNYVNNSNYKISSYFVSFYSNDTSNLYEFTLDKLVDCIENIEITDKKDDVVTVSITLKPYKEVSDYTINTALLDSISSDYKNGIISDSELREQLSVFYADIYKESCFKESNESVQFDVELVEKDGFVEETVRFLETLLDKSGIDANLKKYQSEIKIKVNDILEE